jgi:hypothetical protein
MTQTVGGVIQDGALLASFFAFDPTYLGGVRVASGDLNGDGRADVIVASAVNVNHIKAFSGNDFTLLLSFIIPSTSHGLSVAAGDLNNDGRAEIITGTNPAGGSSRVRILDGQNGSEITSFEAFPGFLGGVNVSALDRNNDGRSEIVAAVASGTSSHVKVFNPDLLLVDSFFSKLASDRGLLVASR